MKKILSYILALSIVFWATKSFAPSIGGGSIGEQISFLGLPTVSATVITGNQVYFGTGLALPSGPPSDNYIIKYDAVTNSLNWEADTGGGGGAHSTLTDLNWASAGHTFDTDLNVRPNNVTANAVTANTITTSRLYSDAFIGTSGKVTANTATFNSVYFGSGGVEVPTNAVGANYTYFYNTTDPTGTPADDGFRMRWSNDFFGTNNDALIIDKTDGNDADPDGGIAFTMTGNDNVTEKVLIMRGNRVVSMDTVVASKFYAQDWIGTGGNITGNTASFNTVQSVVSTHTVRIDGAYALPGWVPPYSGADPQRMVLWADSRGNCSWNTVTASGGGGGGASFTDAQITFVFDGGGSAIVTGSTAFCRVPYGGTITGWDMVNHKNSRSPSFMAVSINTATYANWDTLTGLYSVTNPVFVGTPVTGAFKNTSTTLTGWTTSLTKGDYIEAQVVSCNQVTQSTVTLIVTRSS